jgi:hypothetical protein
MFAGLKYKGFNVQLEVYGRRLSNFLADAGAFNFR